MRWQWCTTEVHVSYPKFTDEETVSEGKRKSPRPHSGAVTWAQGCQFDHPLQLASGVRQAWGSYKIITIPRYLECGWKSAENMEEVPINEKIAQPWEKGVVTARLWWPIKAVNHHLPFTCLWDGPAWVTAVRQGSIAKEGALQMTMLTHLIVLCRKMVYYSHLTKVRLSFSAKGCLKARGLERTGMSSNCPPFEVTNQGACAFSD